MSEPTNETFQGATEPIYYMVGTDPRETEPGDFDDQMPGPDGCCGADGTDTALDLKKVLDPKRMLGRKEFTKNVAKIGVIGAVGLFALGKAKGVAAYYPCGGYWWYRCFSTGCQAQAWWCQRWCGASSYYSCSFQYWVSYNCGGNC